MPAEHLGEPLSSIHSIPGGEARLFERGLTVNGAAGEVVVTFDFPMLGRPSIPMGTSASMSPFDPGTITFRLGDWQLADLAPLIQRVLAGRLSLVATGHAAIRVPLSIGPAALVTPERKPEASVAGVMNPAVFGLSVTAAGLQERQLYDVAILADGDQWRVVAPHALYHRAAWTTFGVAHITDMHVARRIDRFRGLLVQAGHAEAAQRLYNWNDRFRGFVRYANHLHGIGVLDVIVATGDLYDYLFEDDDDTTGGGNAAFLRQLILGQAPGPDFPDVEELLVPIFMVPGNHDYRKHPYKLLFDAQIRVGPIGKDVHRFKNFSEYCLLQEEARVLTNRLEGLSGPEVLNVTVEQAARMVEVDAEIKPYKAFLADRGSYIVRLGAHRIAMVDSAHDVGVAGITEAALVKVGLGTEDESMFVGGSPNCEGVSADELTMVSQALAETPDGALFMLGLHAPLFNMWNNEYPYFLRETQRPAQPDQAHGFLARHDKTPVLANSKVEAQVEARHPLWFAGEHDRRRAPTFVKRVDSQDLMDFGVSRGHAGELIRLLAGVGSRRPADVVLAGHTHRYNEFRVRKMLTGELAFYMDFYTQNPRFYYPTRFTQSWAEGPRGALGLTVEPKMDVTYVEVVPGAAPDAKPLPMSRPAMFKNQLEVPPYATPLSSSPDPRAWWAEHRPLVLQTGALGPLDNSQVSFTGFRVLSVKNDVIDRIHFVSTERLEASQYRLPWEDAIRPENPDPMVSGRLLFYRDASQSGGGDVSSPVIIGQGGWQAFKFLFSGGPGIIYAVDRDGRLLLYRDASHNGGGDVSSPAVIGQGGWQAFKFLFPGGPGIIYAVDRDGRLLLFHDASQNGGGGDVSSPAVIGQGGWQAFKFLFSGGPGIIYAVDQDGRLLLFRDASQTGGGDVSSPVVIGQGGWQTFKSLFSGGPGIIYAVDSDGNLLLFHDASQTGGGDVSNPAVIGHGGWQAFKFLFSGGPGTIYAVVT
jgi:hypothetical protein